VQVTSNHMGRVLAGEEVNGYARWHRDEGIMDSYYQFYENIYTRADRVIDTLHMISTTQMLLESRDIPYVMINAMPIVGYKFRKLCETLVEQNALVTEEIDQAIGMVNWSRFLGGQDWAYLNWAIDNKFEIGENMHPLERAHRELAEKISREVFNL